MASTSANSTKRNSEYKLLADVDNLKHYQELVVVSFGILTLPLAFAKVGSHDTKFKRICLLIGNTNNKKIL